MKGPFNLTNWRLPNVLWRRQKCSTRHKKRLDVGDAAGLDPKWLPERRYQKWQEHSPDEDACLDLCWRKPLESEAFICNSQIISKKRNSTSTPFCQTLLIKNGDKDGFLLRRDAAGEFWGRRLWACWDFNTWGEELGGQNVANIWDWTLFLNNKKNTCKSNILYWSYKEKYGTLTLIPPKEVSNICIILN